MDYEAKKILFYSYKNWKLLEIVCESLHDLSYELWLQVMTNHENYFAKGASINHDLITVIMMMDKNQARHTTMIIKQRQGNAKNTFDTINKT